MSSTESPLRTGGPDGASLAVMRTALMEARKAFKSPAKTKTNPAFSTQYAGLDDLLAANDQALTDNGFIPLATTVTSEAAFTLTICLQHVDGGWVEGDLAMPVAKTPQGVGTALTYARRYLLSAMLGVASEEDTDGHDQTAPPPRRAPAARKQAQGGARPPKADSAAPGGQTTYRSPQEAVMRGVLDGMDEQQAKETRKAFKEKFGVTLSGLEKERHQEAAEWMSDYLAEQASAQAAADEGPPA